jgi:hypothetical protein
MAISWGLTERVKFTSGGQLSNWVAPSLPAVYSVTYKRDPANKAKAHTVLYFGEASDLSRETPTINQFLIEIADSDVRPSDLFIFIHPMPGSTQHERMKLMQTLIGDYRPRGNGY